jgi:prevent-host-death family protein
MRDLSFMVMKKIAAAKFRAYCLKVMEQVRSTREPVLVTKRGQPLAKLVPAAEKISDDFIGRLEGVITMVGDIEPPTTPLEDCDALR